MPLFVFHVSVGVCSLVQNFEDWDDVGLNIPKPPNLLQLVRHYNSFSLSGQEHHQQISQMVRNMAKWSRRGGMSHH